MKIKQEAADLDNLTLYKATSLSFTESFFMSRKRKTEFRSRLLVTVFPAKANLLALAIFKQRIPISRWQFSNKGFRFPVGSIMQRLKLSLAEIA